MTDTTDTDDNGTGAVEKDKQYLARIKRNTSKLLQKDHPRHHGIRMQAHHAISVKSLQVAGIGPQLKLLGYRINELPNLVFLPWTLAGACHLGIQPHRGDHTAPARPAHEDDFDDDSQHELSYHRIVSIELKRVARDIDEVCSGKDAGEKKGMLEGLDTLSRLIITRIQKIPHEYPLTSVAHFYRKGHAVGCGGHTAVATLAATKGRQPCPAERNHSTPQVEGQPLVGISYPANASYKLRPGY